MDLMWVDVRRVVFSEAVTARLFIQTGLRWLFSIRVTLEKGLFSFSVRKKPVVDLGNRFRLNTDGMTKVIPEVQSQLAKRRGALQRDQRA